MASWAVSHAPWWSIARTRLRPELWPSYSRAWAVSNTYFSTAVLSDEPPSSRALKAYPYPSVPADNGLFEDETEEYIAPTSFSPPLASHLAHDGRPCYVLRKAVQEGNLEDAERIYSELVRFGTPIMPDAAYDVMAEHIVHEQNYPNRLDAFARWWSLTPHKSQRSAHDNLGRMRWLLLRDLEYSQHEPNFALAVPFALISAEKGYGYEVTKEALSLISRYADPKVSTPLLRRLIRIVREYGIQHDVSPETTLTTMRSLYDFGITTQISAGRHEEAFALLEHCVTDDICLSPGTMDVLADMSAKMGDEQGLKRIAELAKKLSPSLGDAETVSSKARVRVASIIPRQPQPDKITPIKVPRDMSPVAVVVAAKRALISKRPVNVNVIVRSIGLLNDLDRMKLLSRFRDRAYRHSNRAYRRWILAQMLYYRQCDDTDLLLETFGESCHGVGIPRAIALDWVKQEPKEVDEDENTYDAHECPPEWHKFSPTPAHTSIVWEAAVRGATDDSELRLLYDELCHMVARQKGLSTWHGRDLPTLKPFDAHIPPSHSFDAAHFMPFVYRFSTRHGPATAEQVIEDMRVLGIPLTLPLVSFFAGALARAGDATRVWRLLDALERPDSATESASNNASTGDTQPSNTSSSTRRQKKKAPSLRHVRPNGIMYTSIIRGLLDAGRVTEARAAATRMAEKIDYVKDSNSRTEAVLMMLADKERA